MDNLKTNNCDEKIEVYGDPDCLCLETVGTGTGVEEICRMVCLSSSMYYYRPQPREDTNLRLRIRDIALSRVRYGFWRIFVLLRWEGFTDNHKRVYCLYKEEGLNLRSKRPPEVVVLHIDFSG